MSVIHRRKPNCVHCNRAISRTPPSRNCQFVNYMIFLVEILHSKSPAHDLRNLRLIAAGSKVAGNGWLCTKVGPQSFIKIISF